MSIGRGLRALHVHVLFNVSCGESREDCRQQSPPRAGGQSEKGMGVVFGTVPDDDALINDDLSFLEVVQPRVDRELAEQLINFWRSTTFFLLILLAITWLYYRDRIYLFYFGPKLSSSHPTASFASPKSRAMTPLVMSPKPRSSKVDT